MDKFVGPFSKKSRRQLSPILREQVYVSLHQASKWGMRSLQATFTRLKSRLTKERREAIMLGACLLHNFRTHFMGLNQITTVFDAHYAQYISLETYDRIARYFNFDDDLNLLRT